jgi:transposase
MARKRIGMKKIRDVIRLKSTTELSERQIARALSISRPIVAKYWNGFLFSGLAYEQIAEMADSELLRLVERPRESKSARYREMAQYFSHIVVELKRKGVTLQLLWEEYKEKHSDGYQYSQFCYHFNNWKNASEVRMHIKHKAGDKMFVDYAGEKWPITDTRTGKKRLVEVFVAVLGASGLSYVEATASQQEQDWIRSNERALWYFGGVAAAIIPDNLRSAVSQSDRYEPGLVENAVLLAYQRIYAPLRNRTFYSLEELNEAIGQRLEEHNNKSFQRLDISRRELFERTERSALRPLPSERYPMKETRRVTVQFNYHVELREDLHYYSVPHYLYKKEPKTKVKMVFDERIVAIYYDNIRVAQHIRDRSPNGYTTLPEHMPAEHRFYAEWSPQRILRWAKAIGEEVARVIEKVLDSRKHPEQAFKVCLGILSLSRKYGAERLQKACRKADRFGTYSFKRIESMLKVALEEEKHPELELIPAHENIRGSGYYN